jgi:hypothetical protein
LPPTSLVGAKAAVLQIPTPSSRPCFFRHPGLVFSSSRPCFFVIPALFFVIPALSRDPQRTADLCKGQQTTLDPGSSPGMTNTTNWMTDQKLHQKAAKKSEDYPNWGLFVFVFDDIFKFQSLKPSKKETNLTSINMSILSFKASKS